MGTAQEKELHVRLKVGIFTILGVVLIGAITVFVNDKPYWWSGCQDEVNIKVEDATGLKTKSPIRSLGLQIGYLQSVRLFKTHVRLTICVSAPVEVLPSTRAYIRGQGFLGDKFVELKPVRYVGSVGSDDEPLESADEEKEESASLLDRLLPGCFETVNIDVEDATGLKQNSPVRSLGLQIGHIEKLRLTETHVRLKLCIEEKVEVLPSTRAYVRAEGFLGDKFVELKPVRFLEEQSSEPTALRLLNWLFPAAYAQTSMAKKKSAPMAKKRRKGRPREVPVGRQSQDVQQLVNEVDGLVGELTVLTSNLKKAFDPVELQRTMLKLNQTLENASRTFSPEGNLTSTAQRALAKLEDAIEQMRDQMTRVNRGDGSLGKLLNDPVYAKQIELALKNINNLLNKASTFRLVVDMGVDQIPAYSDGRGWFKIALWPTTDRYYLVGASVDPRGKLVQYTTSTTVGGTTTQVVTNQVEKSGLLITAALGKMLWRFELGAGLFHGDAGVRFGFHFGPSGDAERFRVIGEGYLRSQGAGFDSEFDGRAYLMLFPSRSPYLKTIYLSGGIESFKKINGKFGYHFGAGLSFDDDDIKMLLSFL